MSRRGDCFRNAPVESFFSTLKTELVYQQRFATRREARRTIFEYVEIFPNRKRRHSALGYLSPVEFEEHQRAQPLIAHAA
jgi:transposase InsO family protein